MGISVQKLFYFVYPWIQIEGLGQPFELYVFRTKVLVELNIEQFKKICPFVSQSAVDFDEGRLGLIKEWVDERSFAGGFLTVEQKGGISFDQFYQDIAFG